MIFGCAGAELRDEERRLFAETEPSGFILFARNCRTPDQVRALTASLRDSIGWDEAPLEHQARLSRRWPTTLHMHRLVL